MMSRKAHVTMPEKTSTPTKVQVAMSPMPLVKDRNRKGKKLVGMTLQIS